MACRSAQYLLQNETMKFKKIGKQILHVKMETTRELSTMLVRFQEHYESPLPEIRGKIFTLGMLRARYSEEVTGGWTYHGNSLIGGDWAGFNFPDYVIRPFAAGLFDPLSESERDFLSIVQHRQDKFYVIGTSAEDTGTIEHEVCHAHFYLDEDYRKAATALVNDWSESVKMGKMLADWGYCDEVLVDEVHAYVSADYKWLCDSQTKRFKKFDVDITSGQNLHDELQKIRRASKLCTQPE